jgi:hypothetical protein
MGHPGIQAWEEQGIAPLELSKIWQGAEARSIRTRQGEADEKLFQDDAGFEQAASFEIEVGLEEPGWKLVHPARSKVGMLFPGFFHGEGGHTGQPTCLVEVHACGSEPAGVVEFQQVRAYLRQQ